MLSILPTTHTDLTADALDLRDAVIHDGLVLTRERGRLTLHTLEGGRAHRLGTYRDVRDAWIALDAIDAPELAAAA